MFIDVDFSPLIARKVEVIRSNPQLGSLIQEQDLANNVDGLHIRSAHYCALGCDLTDIGQLDRLLHECLHFSKCIVLCTAEVSVTYMNVDAADSLISWAGQYDDSKWHC